jgi:hypothetical protein
MDIKDLIERIVESTSSVSNSHFTFILADTNAKCCEYLVDCRGERVASCDYYGLSIDTHEAFSVDEAVAFLFDCDIHLWELVSYEVDTPIYGAFGYWRIKL